MKIRYIFALTTFAAAGLLLSCAEDVKEDEQRQGEPIRILFTTNDIVDYVTRTDAATRSQTTELCDSDGVSLFIQSTELSGIHVPEVTSPFAEEPSFFEEHQTRGTQTTTFATDQTVTIDAFDHSGAFSATTTKVASGQSFNLAFTPSSASANLDFTATGKHWPYNQSGASDRRMSFFAYYPTAAATLTDGGTGYPTLSYTASTTLANQIDILVAKAVDKTRSNLDANGKLPIAFDHALSAVVFKVGSNVGIKAGSLTISVKGVYTTGTYTFADGSWTPSTAGNYSLPAYTVTSSAASVSTLSSNAMFLIPQTIPSGATLDISYTDTGGGSHSFSKKLNEISSITTWQPGHTYEYTLSTSASISTMTVNYPSGWTSGSSTVAGPVTDYVASSDHFGLYAVDKNNNIVFSNLDVPAASVNTTSHTATLDLSTSHSGKFFSSQYTYYLYYPWKSSPGTVNASATDADTFFANVISNWTIPETNQSAVSTYKTRDLQAAKTSGSGTVSFSMAHKMGLLVIEMGTASANTIPETYYYDSHSTSKNYYTANCTSAVKAFGAFRGTYLPCPHNSSAPYTSDYYYYLVQKGATPNANVKFVSTIDQWDNVIWNTGISSATVASNTYYKATVNPKWKNKGVVYRYQTTDDNVLTTDHSGAGNSPHTFPITLAGTYRMECWGARGGYGLTVAGAGADDQRYHGRGAYTAGDITFTASNISSYPNLYVYVGGRGQSPTTYANTQGTIVKGGYNGGGYGIEDTDPNDIGGGGGGATDIRLNSTLGSRIMVAGGGGGGHDTNTQSITPQTAGMHAGGPNITNLGITGWMYAWTATVNQRQQTNSTISATNTFGIGLNGVSINHGSGGGGGGYWGGFANRNNTTGYQGKASGGSSFVSGHASCEGITADNNTTPSGKNYHHSGLKFSNITIYAGNTTMPSPTAAAKTPTLSQITSGYSTETTGHDADGYARITFFPYGK